MIRFTKMQGIGNDYLFLDAFETPKLAARNDLPTLAIHMSDRHLGVGADGIILVSPPTRSGADRGACAQMRMFNADGSEGEMCGNGVRCVAKLVADRGHATLDDNQLRIETGAGVLSIMVEMVKGKVQTATVDMGEPIVALDQIPVDASRLTPQNSLCEASQWLVDDLSSVFVSMGNPHLVSFVERLPEAACLEKLGPKLERHAAFPNRMNIHLVTVGAPSQASMLTWERGSGMTQACGTGACAVLVAGRLTGRLDREATIRLPGGELDIRWDEPTNHVFMTGRAAEVFTGQWCE